MPKKQKREPIQRLNGIPMEASLLDWVDDYAVDTRRSRTGAILWFVDRLKKYEERMGRAELVMLLEGDRDVRRERPPHFPATATHCIGG